MLLLFLQLKPYKPILLPIEQDHLGMIPQALVNALEDWKRKCTEEGGGCKMPKLLYMNPTGSNPTGTTMPLERRREIYKICSQYNILILEDDAYCFMNFSEEPVKSFLSLDTEGRVLRFDSLSKVLSSGMRVGWVTGPKPLIQNIELHVQSSYLHSSTLSQVSVKLFMPKQIEYIVLQVLLYTSSSSPSSLLSYGFIFTSMKEPADIL